MAAVNPGNSAAFAGRRSLPRARQGNGQGQQRKGKAKEWRRSTLPWAGQGKGIGSRIERRPAGGRLTANSAQGSISAAVLCPGQRKARAAG